jgi:recombination protein RecT
MSTDLQRRMSAQAQGLGDPTPNVTDLLRRMQPELARALPRHLSSDRMARLALTEIRRNPKLARASAESLLGALMYAAQLGLEPGPLGHVYLTPRTIGGSLEVVFVVGYRGYVELAYRSERVRSIQARVVWQGEAFRYEAGDAETIEHTPDLDVPERKPAEFRAAYAIAQLTTGGTLREVLGVRQINRAKGASVSGNKGPWATDYESMARKTAIRRLSAVLPQSPELAAALALDETLAPPFQGRMVPLEEVEPRPVEPQPEPQPAPASERDPRIEHMTDAWEALPPADRSDLAQLLVDAGVAGKVSTATPALIVEQFSDCPTTPEGLKRLRDHLAEATK